MNTSEEARKLFEKYSFLELKIFKGFIEMSEGEKKLIDDAISLHRKNLKEKLDAKK